MPVVRAAGATTLSDEEEQVVGGIAERMRGLGGHRGRTGDDCDDGLGERDREA
jgi:hypothetical protein